MQKKVLTEVSLYCGDVSMPKDWEIDQNDLAHHILQSNLTDEQKEVGTHMWGYDWNEEGQSWDLTDGLA